MKHLFKSGSTKHPFKICIALLMLTLVVTSFAAALHPVEAASKECSHSWSYSYGKKNVVQHTVTAKCKKCGRTESYAGKHNFGYSYKSSSATQHTKTAKCYKCGYTGTCKENHNWTKTTDKTKKPYKITYRCSKCSRKK